MSTYCNSSSFDHFKALPLLTYCALHDKNLENVTQTPKCMRACMATKFDGMMPQSLTSDSVGMVVYTDSDESWLRTTPKWQGT